MKLFTILDCNIRYVLLQRAKEIKAVTYVDNFAKRYAPYAQLGLNK